MHGCYILEVWVWLRVWGCILAPQELSALHCGWGREFASWVTTGDDHRLPFLKVIPSLTWGNRKVLGEGKFSHSLVLYLPLQCYSVKGEQKERKGNKDQRREDRMERCGRKEGTVGDVICDPWFNGRKRWPFFEKYSVVHAAVHVHTLDINYYYYYYYYIPWHSWVQREVGLTR